MLQIYEDSDAVQDHNEDRNKVADSSALKPLAISCRWQLRSDVGLTPAPSIITVATHVSLSCSLISAVKDGHKVEDRNEDSHEHVQGTILGMTSRSQWVISLRCWPLALLLVCAQRVPIDFPSLFAAKGVKWYSSFRHACIHSRSLNENVGNTCASKDVLFVESAAFRNRNTRSECAMLFALVRCGY